jgi:hypothetical protein
MSGGDLITPPGGHVIQHESTFKLNDFRDKGMKAVRVEAFVDGYHYHMQTGFSGLDTSGNPGHNFSTEARGKIVPIIAFRPPPAAKLGNRDIRVTIQMKMADGRTYERNNTYAVPNTKTVADQGRLPSYIVSGIEECINNFSPPQ